MEDTTKICALNDAFRTTLCGGQLMLTRGIAGRPDAKAILKAVQFYNKFDTGSDPHQEHDFGAIECGGDKIFWKIDYYDKSLQYGSPDASDPALTTRVLTVMLAEEY